MAERSFTVELTGRKVKLIDKVSRAKGWNLRQTIGWLLEVGEIFYDDRNGDVTDLVDMFDPEGVCVTKVESGLIPVRTIVQGNCIREGHQDLVLTGTLIEYEDSDESPEGLWAKVALTPASYSKLAKALGETEVKGGEFYIFSPSEIREV